MIDEGGIKMSRFRRERWPSPRGLTCKESELKGLKRSPLLRLALLLPSYTILRKTKHSVDD